MIAGPVDLKRRFGGVARVYGVAAAERIAAAHVCVIGIGGVGSWAVEAFARSGIGALTIIDGDHVAESNINRQVHALDSTLGREKTSVLVERIADITPLCRVSVVEDFLTGENVAELVAREFDYVLDCIDSFRLKAALIAYCRRNKIRLLTVGAAGGQADPTRIRVSDLGRTEHDPLLSKVRTLLRQDYGFSRNPRRRFDVPCVWSTEQAVYPTPEGGVCQRITSGEGAGDLTCSGGIGSVVTVTAGFGLAAAARILNRFAVDG